MVKSTNMDTMKYCKKCLLNLISKTVIINIAQDVKIEMRGIYNEKNQGSLHYPDGMFFEP